MTLSVTSSRVRYSKLLWDPYGEDAAAVLLRRSSFVHETPYDRPPAMTRPLDLCFGLTIVVLDTFLLFHDGRLMRRSFELRTLGRAQQGKNCESSLR